jgi:hypothetical protein
MSRVADYIALIDDPEAPPLEPGHPLDEPLLVLMVFLAYCDGVLDPDELALIERMRPDLDPEGVRAWVEQQADITFDSAALAAEITSPVERWGALRLATRMVCMDGDVHDDELSVLVDLAAAFGMDDQAPNRAVRDVVATGGPVSEDRLMSSLRNMLWRKAVPSREEPEAELADAAPADGEHVATITLAGAEVAALYVEGLAAAFEGGPRFVRWPDIRTYTRVPVPGASFHLKTADEHLKMADPRMRDIGALLDYVYGRERLPDA